MREHQRASVWPNIEIGPSFQPNEVAFHVRNTGIGPAQIQATKLTYKNQQISDWRSLLFTIANDTTNLKGLQTYQSFINKRVLPNKSERQDIFRISINDTNSTGKLFLSQLGKEVSKQHLNITLCYCSVYEQCWISKMFNPNHATTESSAPTYGYKKPVESCREIQNSDI
ncbi:hypothetical protein [Fodinibius halophilus]|uniref:Uncharacterized protein n=1 Tax=Fodinibius halophilus TaxID=1736908 RepID=A0A6M1T8P6_9BACT|nr:hypothetical protein [Fodinibius halophilus]NGP86752.1 hypothetical protein [Fodinibius halophilus]